LQLPLQRALLLARFGRRRSAAITRSAGHAAPGCRPVAYQAFKLAFGSDLALLQFLKLGFRFRPCRLELLAAGTCLLGQLISRTSTCSAWLWFCPSLALGGRVNAGWRPGSELRHAPARHFLADQHLRAQAFLVVNLLGRASRPTCSESGA
jgi:hypothetical protein